MKVLRRISKIHLRHPTVSLALANLILPILISFRMLPFAGVVNYNDGSLAFNVRNIAPNVLTSFSPNYLGQAQATSLFTVLQKGLATLVLVDLHLGLATASYMLSFGLVYLAAFITSLIAYRISGQMSIALFAGAFTVLCNASLQYMLYGGFVYYFPSYIAFTGFLYLAWNACQRNEWNARSTIAASLLSLLAFQPFIFVMFVGLQCAFALYWVHQHGRKNFLNLLGMLVGPLVLASYWLVPFVDSYYETPNPTATYLGGNLSAVYNYFVTNATYPSTFSLFVYPNGNSAPFSAYYLRIILTIAITGTIAVLGLKNWRSPSSGFRKWGLLVGFVALSLGMGPNSPITGGPWKILWSHYSFLAFFRTFTRFIGLISPLLVVILAVIARDRRQRWLAPLVVAWTLLLVITNLNFLNGSLGGAVTASRVPAAYGKADNLMERLSNLPGSILAIPATAYEEYTWSQSVEEKSGYMSTLTQDYLFQRPIVYQRASIAFPPNPEISLALTVQEDNAELNAIRGLGVRFVLVHKDVLAPNGKPTPVDSVITFFRTNTSLIFESRYFDLFQLQHVAPIIGGIGVTSNETNSALYNVRLSHVSGKEILTLRQLFNMGWSVYVEPWDKKSMCGSLPHGGTAFSHTCPSNLSFALGATLRPLIQDPASSTIHYSQDGWSNTWKLNIQKLVARLPYNYFTINADGTYNLNLQLEFKPQAYFYLGSIVTLSFLALLTIAVSALELKKEVTENNRRKMIRKRPRLTPHHKTET
jgi:hypothetical protein